MIDIDTLLTWGAAYKKAAANEIIFMEGTECHFYYQLISGTVRWVNIGEDGREFLQGIVNPGECFGELPLFDNECFAATAIADTDSVIIRLHKPTFLQLIKENPEIHFAFTKLLTERLRFKFFLLKEMASHDPEQSISTLLNYFKQTRKNMCPDCNKVNLTRQQIADMIGLRVETVIRAIRSLQEKGQLVINKGKVYC
jgi:CRP-like cAMP-binding protein